MRKKENGKNKKTEILNDKMFVVLVTLLAIVSVTLIIVWVCNSNKLETDSKQVVELHNYFSSEDLGNCEGLFTYAEDKIEYKDVNSETRICLAYQKAEIPKDIETETLKAAKKKNICTSDSMVFKTDEGKKECTVSKIKKEIINNSYKKLYGKDIEKDESFRIDNLNICYLKDDYYYCGLSETFTYTLGSESVIYRVMKKAEEKGSDIVIYDYFVKINEDTCFKNYTTTTINQNCTDEYLDKKEINYNFMKKYGTEYKHVFRKSNDDTYYWVSSEPLK